jgi:hypothetical protein
MVRKMKKILIFVLTLTLILALYAENDIYKHSFTYSAGGPGGLITIEYDYHFISTQKLSLSLSAGTGAFFANFSFLAGINCTFGDKHQFLLGLHYVPTLVDNMWADIPSEEEYSLQHQISPRIGYREKLKIGDLNYYLQLYFSPIYQFEYARLFPWGGLGIGIEL